MTLSKAVTVKDTALFLFIFVIFIIGNHTGSLILAGLGALGGLFGIIGHKLPPVRSWPIAIWCLLTLLIWTYISSYWSPYMRDGIWTNAFRFLIGVPLYLLFILAVSKQSKHLKTILTWLLIGGVSLSCCVMAIDYLSGFIIYKLVDPNLSTGYIDKNLNHGLSILAISLPAIIILMLQKLSKKDGTYSPFAKAYAAAIIVVFCVAVIASGNAGCIAALFMGATFFAFATWRPAATLAMAFAIPILLILNAPFLSVLSASVTPEWKASMPASWEWRVEMWDLLSQKILASPFIGNGFDSLRTFDETFTLRGREGLRVVSMHAHNIGLHIWTEIGVIGAMLLAITLIASAFKLIKAPWMTRDRTIALSSSLAAITVFANISYSAWQDWWLAGIFISLSFLCLLPSHHGKKDGLKTAP